jgi:hypothetical protein
VRQTFLGTRYFCWAELQRRGQVHYHAVWLNPPGRRRADLVRLVDRWWRIGRTQVRFKDARWADRDMLAYALKYADKMGRKRYQQAYDGMPARLRTFMSQRLEIPPAELKNHIDRDVYQYTPAHWERGRQYFCIDADGAPTSSGPQQRGQWLEESLQLVGRIIHQVDPEHRCSALDHRRPRRRKRESPGAKSRASHRLTG